MLNLSIRNPANAFAMLAIATLAIVTGAALWIAHLPLATFRVSPEGAARVRIAGAGSFDGTAPVRFVDRADRVRLELPLIILAVERDPAGTPEQNRADYALRDRAAGLLRENGMALVLPDGSRMAAAVVPGTFANVPWGSWLAFGMGLASALCGWWVLVLRPREWAARMFAISGAAMLLAAITIAASEKLSPALGFALQLRLALANMLAAHGYGLSLVALFARYPYPLVSRRLLAMAAGGAALLWLFAILFPSTWLFAAQTAIVTGEGVTIVVLSWVQAWRARRDPALRMGFRLIGGSLLVCIVFFSAVNLVPQILGYGDLVGTPLSSSVFLLFNLALAVAITRYRLFDLGEWTVGVAMVALGIVGVVLLDLALVALTGATWTMSGAFLGAAIVWLPLREVLLRRADRGRTREDLLLLRGASEVAFALGEERQERRWRSLLQRRFAPLEIVAWACDDAAIGDDGRELFVPSPFGPGGQRLRFAGQGRRLFGSTDRRVAEALVALVREMTAARAAYDRGVREERLRIARDLHDDVGARLMTTLHRPDLDTVRAEVREAMADMRLIIDGMSGQSRPLADLLADLRHETVTRFRLAGIAADWPVDALLDDGRPVDARLSRVLCSVVRELASNAIRHARAGSVRIAVELAGDRLAFALEDDGIGFDPAVRPAGNGLRNMQRRLDEVGGMIELISGPGGTRARIVLPLGSPERGMADAAAGEHDEQG